LHEDDPAIAIILAAADFEWTVRRAIVALGSHPTKFIRKKISKLSGLPSYEKAWRQEVAKRVGGIELAKVVSDWKFFKESAYDLRNRIVHGATSSVSVAFAQPRLDALLAASAAVTKFATVNGEPLYGRMIRRSKAR